MFRCTVYVVQCDPDILDRSVCSTMCSVVFAVLFGGISGELLLLGLSPRFPPMISGLSTLSLNLSAIYLRCRELTGRTTRKRCRPSWLSLETHHQHHQICSYAYKVHCQIDKYSKAVKLYRGENATENFLKNLLKENEEI